jgi:HEAT repeat protein
MNIENKIDPNLLAMLFSDDPDQKTEALYNLTIEDVDESIIKDISKMLEDDDKAVRNAASNFLIQNGNLTIPANVIGYISSDDIAIRNLAGEILLKKSTDSINTICTQLSVISNDDDVKFLVDILGLIGDKCAEDLLIDILIKNKNENVIVACIEALGNINSEKAMDSILPFYDKSDVLKPCVIEAAGKIRSLKSLKFITEKFDSDDDLLRFTMIESLGEIGDETTFYFLISQLDNLDDTFIAPLLEAIYKLKNKYNLELPFDEKIKKCVLETITNAEPRYQVIAAHLVTVFDDPEILTACLDIYGLDMELNEILFEKFLENKKLILSRLYPIINNANKNIISVLELLNNIILNDPQSVEKLPELEKRRLIESLSQNLTNPDESIRIAAAELLFKIDLDTALLFIDTMISDENFWNRMRLLDLIAEIEQPVIKEVFEKLTNDPEEMVSEKAKELALRKQYFNN